MRDPGRIDGVLEAIRKVWVQSPDLRLGQLLVNAVRPTEPCPNLFYMEEAELVKRLEGFDRGFPREEPVRE